MTVNLVLSGGNFERPGCEIPISDYFCSGTGSIGWSHLCFSLKRPIGLKFLNFLIEQTANTSVEKENVVVVCEI